jgi:hypothetical protein
LSYYSEMELTLAHTAAVVAGLAIVASPLMVSRKGLLPGLAAAVALGIVAAVLITVIRGIA